MFIYENNELIYQNKEASLLNLDTNLLNNLISGAIILAKNYLNTEFVSINLNGLNFFIKIIDNKFIFTICNEKEFKEMNEEDFIINK